MEMNKPVFWMSFISLLGVSTFFGYSKNIGAMSLSIIAGAIGMAFANLDKFQKIKGAGFEAELKKAVEKAYVTTTSLKDLAANMASTLLVMMATEGRIGGMSLRRKMQVIENIDSALSKSGLSAKEVKETHKVFDQYLLWDHARKIVKEIIKTENVDNDVKESFDRLMSHEMLTVAKPAEFKSLIKKYHINNHEADELILDLEHYLKKQTLRRPDQWLQ